jgi:membrane protease YdiL (CAAX protease family)
MARLLAATVIAVLLSFAGGSVWGALFRANVATRSAGPWSAVVMVALVALLWRALARLPGFGRPLPCATRWAWLATVAVTACCLSLIFLGLRIGHFSAADFASSIDMGALGLPLAISRVVVTALVAAFFEEAGFRGILQPELAKRFGVSAAVVATSVIFYAIHLVHGWAWGDAISMLAIALPMVCCGILFGILTYATGSLTPAIIAHLLTDSAALPLEWTARHNLTPLRLDAHAAAWTVALVLSSVICWHALHRLKKTNPQTSMGKRGD